MKIAALQMVSTPRVADNLATARRLMEQAARQGAHLVALPEYFCLMGHSDRDKLTVAEAPGHGPIQQALADAARELQVWVVGGSLPIAAEPMDGGRVYNRCCVYRPDGTEAAHYDKMHLFRYQNEREHYDEARVLRAGERPVALALDGLPGLEGQALRLGLSICYDLRFPELYRALSFAPGQPPCDLIAVPSAFTFTTGRAHWELLLRARAVENQCYVMAPAQGGVHENGRRTWGHTLVADPWGEVVALQPEGEGVVLADIDLVRLAAVRRQLPALSHVRDIRHTLLS